MSKYLILTSIFFPENAANAIRMRGLVDTLLEHGHHVDIVCSFPYYPGSKREKRYLNKWFVKEKYRQARVLRCYVPERFSKKIFQRLATFFYFMVLSVIGTIRFFKGSYDAVLCISPPFFTAVSAYLIAKTKSCQWFFDIQDLYPETALHLKMIRKGPVYFALKLMELFKASFFFTKPAQAFLSFHPGLKSLLPGC
ncbi:hypothetical protein ACFL35_21555 [Candidatus Riflebacteria bacterium]